MSSYQFRREDNGEVVEVDFAYMMEHQDVGGFITLPDGTQAKRINRPTEKPETKADGADRPVVSDALGFCEYQLGDFETDRKMNGIKGIEFRRDPSFPQFFQAVGSQKAMEAYSKHRGFEDKNPTSGAALSPQMLEKAKEMVLRTGGADGA